MPAQKRLVGMYPDWPNTDPADVCKEVHRRLLLLAKNVQMEAGKHGSVRYVAERSQVSYTMITRFVRGESIPGVFCSGIIEDLFLWAMNDERSAMEGRKVLKEHGVQDPEALLTLPYDSAGLAGGELELWHGEPQRNYLHWLIQNTVAAEREGDKLPAWQVTGFAAVTEWMRNQDVKRRLPKPGESGESRACLSLA